jgi:hypothetical protein
MRNNWPNLPYAVGAIDGTSTEIYRPMIEPQQHKGVITGWPLGYILSPKRTHFWGNGKS